MKISLSFDKIQLAWRIWCLIETICEINPWRTYSIRTLFFCNYKIRTTAISHYFSMNFCETELKNFGNHCFNKWTRIRDSCLLLKYFSGKFIQQPGMRLTKDNKDLIKNSKLSPWKIFHWSDTELSGCQCDIPNVKTFACHIHPGHPPVYDIKLID